MRPSAVASIRAVGVDEDATTGVDEDGAVLHGGQEPGVDHPGRLVRDGEGEDDDVLVAWIGRNPSMSMTPSRAVRPTSVTSALNGWSIACTCPAMSPAPRTVTRAPSSVPTKRWSQRPSAWVAANATSVAEVGQQDRRRPTRPSSGRGRRGRWRWRRPAGTRPSHCSNPALSVCTSSSDGSAAISARRLVGPPVADDDGAGVEVLGAGSPRRARTRTARISGVGGHAPARRRRWARGRPGASARARWASGVPPGSLGRRL